MSASALKREWTRADILHALEHVHIDYDIQDSDPPRTWVFGFTESLTLLELLILHDVPGGRVIHCMKARREELNKALRARGRR
ncbi:MAG: toxin [Spirochaetes bacterium]|nr:MAG: toxin [Spirochaetota bacterium]